tara:strand:+ start:452 stop:796 length:345 start_codon:yes stop_codon:yes gene_type:complete
MDISNISNKINISDKLLINDFDNRIQDREFRIKYNHLNNDSYDGLIKENLKDKIKKQNLEDKRNSNKNRIIGFKTANARKKKIKRKKMTKKRKKITKKRKPKIVTINKDKTKKR